MSVVQTSFVTISCDGPECNKTVTFPATEQGQAEALADNPWLNTQRALQTSDRRNFTYCSDVCEAKAIETGVHNKLEKRIVEANATAMNLAARAAQQAQQATQALKQGAGVTITG